MAEEVRKESYNGQKEENNILTSYDEKIDEMARFYAKLCVYYYGGRMFEIADSVQNEKAYEYWTSIDYVSDLSDFLRNILEDDAKDFSHLTIHY